MDSQPGIQIRVPCPTLKLELRHSSTSCAQKIQKRCRVPSRFWALSRNRWRHTLDPDPASRPGPVPPPRAVPPRRPAPAAPPAGPPSRRRRVAPLRRARGRRCLVAAAPREAQMAGVGDEPVGAAGRPRRSAPRPKRYWTDDVEGDGVGDAPAAPPPDAAPAAGRKRRRGASSRARAARPTGIDDAAPIAGRKRGRGASSRLTVRSAYPPL